MNQIFGKLIINGKLKVLTGLHIGTSGDFSAIGAVDSIVIRDSVTNQPIIPGSSLKGKMRYLLARTKYSDSSMNMKDIKDENENIRRLFGSSSPVVIARLQFQDIKLSEDSEKFLSELELDLPYTEIKYENTIDRTKGSAMPRQQERVPSGAEFDFKMTYNVEKIEDLKEDLKNIKSMIELLQDDYLGGHGTRGYGRVKFEELKADYRHYYDDKTKEDEIKKYMDDFNLELGK